MNSFTSGRKSADILKRDIKYIDQTADRALNWNRKSRLLPKEIEWLLDNRYLCRREGEEARRALIGSKNLPRSNDFPSFSEIYVKAEELVSKNEEISEGKIEKFLKEAQDSKPFSEKELWLFTTMLNAAIISKIAKNCRLINKVLDAYENPNSESPFAAELKAFKMRQAGKVPSRSDEEFAAAAESAHRENAEIMSLLITSLRYLANADLTETLQEAGALGSILSKDKVYCEMDEETKASYRNRLARLAKRAKISETDAALRVLSLSKEGESERERHVGFYLWERPLGKKPSRLPSVMYFLAIAMLTIIPGAIAALLTERIWTAVLLALPLAAMAKNITDAIVTKITPCRPVPRLEIPKGLPDEGKTLCVLATLLSAKSDELVKKLEAYRLANRDAGDNLIFGLLADLPDSFTPQKEKDREVIELAKSAVERLNEKYGGGFYLFTRERKWNERDKIFMAWERKRGALLELCRTLRGKPSGLKIQAGDKASLSGTRFLITLDSDTALTPGAARRMAGSLLHPLNRPEICQKKRVVINGHGVLSPRMAVDLEAAGQSVFSRVFAGQGGLDPYNGAAGEVYHDLFGQGSFHGKGIFDIDAYLICLDGRLPENRILSHDLLEGGYLRAGLMEDVELTDGFPSSARAWFLRQHRWIRGDWQVAKWTFKRELSPLSRWKLFDPLRESLTPIATLAALTVGTLFPGRTFAVILAAALFTSASHLLLSFAERAAKAGRPVGRTHASIITGVPAVASQTFLNLIFLPFNAVMSLHAISLALWRVLVSKKNLLQWKTSEEVERISSGMVLAAREMFAGLIWGVFTAMLTRSVVGWLLGILWAISPFIAHAVSKKSRETERLSDADRAFLHRQAALMWRYFEDFLQPEDHYLIPDNYQERPAAGIASRTSPTNIGLGLLCALAAYDLGLCSKERALSLIGKTLDSLEKFPKWHGHLLNWYDTKTLEPLPPRCVSSVDSGNLCGCLIALKHGLLELADGEEFAAKAGKLADEMDFRPLYDEKKKLFKIGIELDNPNAESGVYDLLASEARQTSYIAVARGEAEKKHWQKLGRAQTALGRYRGMASWTGSMFEYFMPHLLLPAYKDSLLRESLDFATYSQKALAAARGGPWGVSESCFYAFDASLNYQYKAHGIPSLAYKRGLGEDHVVAPYSSFLTLLTHPSASVKNLRRLHRLGAEGRYGLIEALDFTPSRLPKSGKSHSEIRCYMSHHLGMSLLAVCNALRENVMQKRFMRDAAMGAFAGLLQERVPIGAAVIKPTGREVPEKLKRAVGMEFFQKIERINPERPKMALLSNSSYTVLCTDNGDTRSQCSGEALTLFNAYTKKGGMKFFFGAKELKPERAEFTGKNARWFGNIEGVESALTLTVPENENAELRVLTLKNTSGKRILSSVSAYFEPVLQAPEDYSAHPAFSKLFLDAKLKDGACLIRRRPRAGKKERWLAFICDGEHVGYQTSREEIVGRGSLPVAGELSLACENNEGELNLPPPLDPCVYAQVPVSLEPGEEITLRFALTAAGCAKDATAAAKHMLSLKTNGSQTPDEAASVLEITPAEREEALEWLAKTIYRDVPRHLENIPPLGRDGLWASGISGDLPILLTEAMDNTQWERVSRVVRQHRWLKICGFSSDLVIFVRDGGNYHRPAKTLLMEVLKACRAEHTIGRKSGVHPVDLESLPPRHEAFIRAFAGGEILERAEIKPPEDEGLETIESNIEIAELNKEAKPVSYSWLPDGSFSFEIEGELPPLAWSHTLANRNFFASTTETGTGFIAFQNSRENKYTPWTNDPLATEGGTVYKIDVGGRKVSPFAALDGYKCVVTYGFGFAKWVKRIDEVTLTTWQFVPPERNALVTKFEISGCRKFTVEMETLPVMGVSPEDGRLCSVSTDADGLTRIENPLNSAFSPQTFVIKCSENANAERKRLGRLRLAFSAEESAVLAMGAARNEGGVRLISELANLEAANAELEHTRAYWNSLVKPKIIQSGSEALDNFGNGWALYQVIATRIYARAALYQCGGAYGYRDQLQDVCAAIKTQPRIAKSQILRASARQYEEGDVMHWWHPAKPVAGYSDKGVRTHCSDDLLWLPYVTSEYIENTGDYSLLELKTPYISSKPLEQGEDDRYESAAVTEGRESILKHCLRAFDCVRKRGVGSHGLLLMGTGDWNDGMNLVGVKGKGESVWLTWFAAHTALKFAPLCEKFGVPESSEMLTNWADELISAASAAWDGEWFLRGYYDDGSTLGSKDDAECKIDSIAQSFSAFFGGKVQEERVKAALESAYSHLVDKKSRLIKLFAPPFSGAGTKDPGYIKGYLPGVRENGAQYTHAAIWLAMAFLKFGDKARCLELLELILPATHDNKIYKAEPHVLAADVYSHPAHLGRGGWSHYTGAASWFYRVLIEATDLNKG